MINITIYLEARITQEALASVISALTGPQSLTINQAAGEAVREDAMEYHREFDAQGGWRGKRYMAGSPRAGDFGARVAQGWFLDEVRQDGITIINNAEHFAFKVRGGTITPKRWDFLTIPMVPEARGLYARDYVRITGRKLFRPRKKGGEKMRILAEKTNGPKGFRAVYALKESVTQAPWPNALPPEGRLESVYVRSYEAGLTKTLTS